ncbi:MAG: GNAT family N-acetyltransferase [Pseudobdellovibrionaceae bacterium]
MKLKGLGYKSELIFTDFDGQVDDRGSYLVMRTLTNPNFFWGNLLIFDRPPVRGDFKSWVGKFKSEFIDPKIYHITLAWDSNDGQIGDVTEFTENGFELEAKAVLSAQAVNKPPKYNENLLVRPLEKSEEWEQMIELQTNCAHDNLPRHEWEKFYRSQSVRYKSMSQAGLGNWYGGYFDGKLVAGLGIFHRDGIGRFQIVCTDPDHRRQGLCGTLVYKSALHAFEKMGVKELVMCADPDYYAIKIYESVGFKQQQLEYGVYWWDKDHDK